MHHDCFKNFEDLIFVDDKLPIKTAKIVSLKIFTHTVHRIHFMNYLHVLERCIIKIHY